MKALYYGSYRKPRILLWYVGIIIFIVMMAFIGPKHTDINIFILQSSILSFNTPRIKAIKRIGPHNKDILTLLISGMLGDTLKNNFCTINEIYKNSINLKNKRLTKLERAQFFISQNFKDILIGLLLGDLCAQKRSINGNTNLHFEQGYKNKEYLLHLYDLFKDYCNSKPKISNRLPDKRTNKVYSRIRFVTYSLPCFNEFHKLFYLNNKKVIPLNIEELLTPLGLTYWICDDGTFCKKHKYIRIATNSYTLEEINLLLRVLNKKFYFNYYAIKDSKGYVITISSRSIYNMQQLLIPIFPNMMKYKIGL